MTWYRQYRPQRVEDLQTPAIRECLLEVLRTGRYAQAYLFAGPRGIGKTSSARILARILNDPANAPAILAGAGPLQEPSADDAVLQRISRGTASVVIEQDAASHRGIDDIRALQEAIATAPVEGLLRVVILDEVHMLSNDAFNALLKVVEEPPSRVVFVLATTELHKVPMTIQSRCQIVRFAAAAPQSLESVLSSVIKAEKISITPEQLQRIIAASNGSFRDGLKFLEQVVRDQKVEAELLDSVLGDQQKVEQLLSALAQRQTVEVAAFFHELRQTGVVWSVWQTSVLTALHERMQRAIQRNEPVTTQRRIVALLEYLLGHLSGAEAIDGLNFEVACLGWCLEIGEEAPSSKLSIPIVPAKPNVTSKSPTEKSVEAPASETGHGSTPLAVEPNPLPTIALSDVEAQWPSVLLGVRTKNHALEAVLRQTRVTGTEPGTVVLETDLTFHCEQLMSQKYRSIVEIVLAEKLQIAKVHIAVRIKPKPAAAPEVASIADGDQLAQAVEAAVLSLG